MFNPPQNHIFIIHYFAQITPFTLFYCCTAVSYLALPPLPPPLSFLDFIYVVVLSLSHLFFSFSFLGAGWDWTGNGRTGLTRGGWVGGRGLWESGPLVVERYSPQRATGQLAETVLPVGLFLAGEWTRASLD